jgi:hypothetical protein
MEQPNFVEHPAEVQDPSEFIPRGAQTGNPRDAANQVTARRRVSREARWTLFVRVEVVKKGRDDAIRSSELPRLFAQTPGAFVAPSPLLHEGLPDLRLCIGWFAAMGARPLEQRLICSSLDCLDGKRCIVDLEKAAATPVKATGVSTSQQRLVLNGQHSGGMEPHLVDHAPKINETPNLLIRTPQTVNLHYSFIESFASWSNPWTSQRCQGNPSSLQVADTAARSVSTSGKLDDGKCVGL